MAPTDRPEIVQLGLKIEELDSEFRDLQDEIFELIADDEKTEKRSKRSVMLRQRRWLDINSASTYWTRL